MSNNIIKTDAALQRRVSVLENELLAMKANMTRMQESLRLLAPNISVSLSKSMKSTVIQVLQWASRRDVPKEDAIANTKKRLIERFGAAEITPMMVEYIEKESTRIYNEAAGIGWADKTDQENIKTAGEV